MGVADLVLAIVLLGLAIVSGLCAASETAMFSLTHTDRVRLSRIGPGTARVVEALLSHPRRLLLVILLLTNAANVAYFVVSAVVEMRLAASGAPAWLRLGANFALLVALIVLADLVPKLLARRARVQAARVLARPLAVAVGVVGPLCAALDRLVVTPLVRLTRPASNERGGLDVEELSAVLELSAASGDIGADEQQMLSDVVQLGRTRVGEVMTPRVALQWIDATASVDAVRATVLRARREKLPVFPGSLDDAPLGLLNVRKYLRATTGIAPGDAPRLAAALRAAIEPAVFVPERARLDRVFEVLSSRGQATALVVDEFGAVAGLVALSDLVKQLVAPVRLADMAAAPSEGGVVRLRADAWSVPGRMPVRTLREFLVSRGAGTAIGGSGADTIAGLVLQRLGRLANLGDKVRLADAGIELEVVQMDGRAVQRVELRLATSAGGAA